MYGQLPPAQDQPKSLPYKALSPGQQLAVYSQHQHLLLKGSSASSTSPLMSLASGNGAYEEPVAPFFGGRSPRGRELGK